MIWIGLGVQIGFGLMLRIWFGKSSIRLSYISKNIIIHGLSEVPDGEGESCWKAEEDQLQDLLHGMKCDGLSIKNIVRFGPYRDSQQKPRPLTVELASEQQREQAVIKAKNLHGNLTFRQVFVQRDLTVKQMEKRRQLVQQLKQRKANGEVGLIIIQDKIVVRRKKVTSAWDFYIQMPTVYWIRCRNCVIKWTSRNMTWLVLLRHGLHLTVLNCWHVWMSKLAFYGLAVSMPSVKHRWSFLQIRRVRTVRLDVGEAVCGLAVSASSTQHGWSFL